MRTILFTLNALVTPNASKICTHQSGRRYKTPHDLIDALMQFNLIKDDSEVVIYEVWEYTHEVNATAKDTKTVKDKNTFIGHITVK